MEFIAVYKTDYSSVGKPTHKSIFSLPGEYYVFQEIGMTKQVGNSYKDPFIYFDDNQKPNNLIINDIELTDIELLYTYNSTFQMTINLYDRLKKTNKTIYRSGSLHTKAFHHELSFIIKTMSELPEDRNWELFNAQQEIVKLKKEVDRLKEKIEKFEEIN